MGLREKRARHKEDFRLEILNSARELFIDDGYEKFSMRKLAEKIDYSPTTIYHYFKNKDDLLFAICEDFFDQFFAQLTRFRSVSRDPVETLRLALLYLIEFGLKSPDQYVVILLSKHSAYGTRDEFVQKESMARNTYFAFKDMVGDCIKAGRLKEIDEDVISCSFAAVSHGLVMMNLCRPTFVRDNINQIAHALVDAVLRGYRK
ncbi:MAG: TetR/AcrR family transcriptional regulator [Nitrospirae bacterium]|nr:TetR/AcrR family transcriptional regulator [Nitrospirota bacterium]